MKVIILGSTGSIGRQVLDVVRSLKKQGFCIDVVGLSANHDTKTLTQQILEFSPKYACVSNPKYRQDLPEGAHYFFGEQGLEELALAEADMLINALVGAVGLRPTLAAIDSGKNIALANKETLVCAGQIIMPKAAEKGVEILPIDSEHSAIFQCIQNNDIASIEKIHLTASGGAFRDFSPESLANVTLKQALAHPNWSMGKKITIDSATMMNKGLEVIEAKWLFGLAAEQINVVIHRESLVHSMVEFSDGQILAQLGPPDMRLPIQYALTQPLRPQNSFKRLDFSQPLNMSFAPPDYKLFPCLGLAYEALRAGGLMPTVLNAANEAAVELFLQEKVSFIKIPQIVESVLQTYNPRDSNNLDIDNIFEADKWARSCALRFAQD